MVATVTEHDELTLADRVARRIREMTSGRISDLAVEEVRGDVIVRGVVKSHHLRQLALHGALELIESDRCRPMLTVG
jgi:hypothetical protein